MKKIRAYWASLEEIIPLSKRELVLALTTSVLAGIVVGVFFGPKKTVTIGCNNGNNYDPDCDFISEDAQEN